ncbi:hypothetical protein [Nannocystis pusilla]|uniref:hypothetical protein n=1 Tax=Nannocystis pusilla TaxID=889268 RepID=UPI003B800BFF
MQPPLRLRSCLTLALLAGACAPPDPYEGSFELLPPVTTRDGLVWVDPARDEVVFVLPKAESVTTRRAAVGDEHTVVAWSAATRDQNSVLALTIPASAKEEDIDEQLYRFPADGKGDPVVYDVQAPFTAAALSPDHRRAILYFGGDGSSEQLHNANQIAIVDLEGKGVENVTLNGFGGTLKSVEFPGQIVEGEQTPILIGGVAHDIAAFLADSEVVLMDLDDPALDQVAVPLGSDIGFSPRTTLLRPGNGLFADPALFVLSAQGSEVGMLTLIDEGDGSGFTAQISLIPVGQTSSDFIFYDSASVPTSSPSTRPPAPSCSPTSAPRAASSSRSAAPPSGCSCATSTAASRSSPGPATAPSSAPSTSAASRTASAASPSTSRSRPASTSWSSSTTTAC